MRTSQERIAALHQRADMLHRQVEKRIMAGWGCASVVLFSILLKLLVHWINKAHIMQGSQMTASSLLDSSAGGYVMVAVIAFCVGVILTVVIRRQRSRDHEQKEPDSRSDRERDD